MDAKQNKSNVAFRITGNWANQLKKLKTKFSQLTDSDLRFEKSKENKLIGRLETRLSKNRQMVIDTEQNHTFFLVPYFYKDELFCS